MTIPLSYYITNYLGSVIEDGWIFIDSVINTSFMEAEILALYGVDTEAEATDLAKLYAITKPIAWLFVMGNATVGYDFSADGASYKRSQVYENAKTNYLLTLSDALPYMPSYEIEIATLTHTEDPYDVGTYEYSVI